MYLEPEEIYASIDAQNMEFKRSIWKLINETNEIKSQLEKIKAKPVNNKKILIMLLIVAIIFLGLSIAALILTLIQPSNIFRSKCFNFII